MITTYIMSMSIVCMYLISMTLYLEFNGGLSMDTTIFKINSTEYSLSFSLDNVSSGYLSCIIIVFSSVMTFSMFYMKGTENYRRFFYLVLLFVVSMMLMVTSNNFITTMVGWDGLGMTSFCLVVFYESANSMTSGILTILTNRLGDSMFLCTFFYLILMGGFNSNSLMQTSNMFYSLLFTGAITKSAQMPFSSWLPAAMAAPTPVSSLVHSSTLVTAGIYVMTRFNFMFFSQMWTMMIFGSVTMLLSGLMATIETDLKKLVAMSTLSQLGMMTFCLSLGLWKMTLLHMMLHSFFKSMMFLSTGGTIFSMQGSQDSRFYPTMLKMKISMFPSMVSSMCLSGFPFILGFYSKDSILSNSSTQSTFIVMMIFLLSCSTTIIYSIRFISIMMTSSFMGPTVSSMKNNKILMLSMMPLFLPSLTLGPFMYVLSPKPDLNMKMMDLMMGMALIFMSTMVSMIMPSNKKMTIMVNSMAFMDWLSNNGLSQMMEKINSHLNEISWMEMIGETQTTTNWLKNKIKSYKNNSITSILTMALTTTTIFY